MVIVAMATPSGYSLAPRICGCLFMTIGEKHPCLRPAGEEGLPPHPEKAACPRPPGKPSEHPSSLSSHGPGSAVDGGRRWFGRENGNGKKMGAWVGSVAAKSGIAGACVPLSGVAERHLSYSSECLQGQRSLRAFPNGQRLQVWARKYPGVPGPANGRTTENASPHKESSCHRSAQ